jgi:cbb3-type cytochrome oxidase maturation protein
VSVLYVLVPVALGLVVTAVLAFVWAARQGQFDDTTTPSWRAVLDDDGASVPDPAGSPRDDSALRGRHERVRS